MAGRVASRGFAVGVGFLGSLVWARCFDKAIYGHYQIVAAAMGVVATFCLPGLDDASMISSAKQKDGNLAVIVRQRIAVSIIGALVIAGWGVVRYRSSDAIVMWAFVATALVFVPIQLQPLWDAFTNGKRRFRLLALGEMLVAVASLIGVGVFALLGWTQRAMLPWIVLASLGLTAVVALGLLGTLPGMKQNDERDRSIVTYGHHVTAASLLTWVFKSDRLIVGEVMAAPDVAMLSIALILPNQVKVFFTAFEQIFLPRVTAAGSVREAWDYIRPRMARLWAAYSALGVVGFFALPIAIPLLFSHRYAESVPYARWLWLSLCLSSPFTFLASILNAQRDKSFLYLKSIASPAVTLVMFVVLIPRYGLAGAVAARVANHVMISILHAVYFAWALGKSTPPRAVGEPVPGPLASPVRPRYLTGPVRFWMRTLVLLAVLFVAFELACRLVIGHAPATRFDKRYDRLTRANQPVVQSTEGFARLSTNELGHLDAPMPSPLPPDGILVIGDSYTEARQVAMAERFTDRLGAALHRRVYNVGHTGWSPIHAVAFLAAERATFSPATVIVQISGNDLDDIVAPKRPHVVADPGGLHAVWPNRDKRGLAKRITDLREAVIARSAFAGDLLTALLSLKEVEDAGGDRPACAAPTRLQLDAVPWLFGELKRAHPDVRLVYLPLLDYHGGCTDRCATGRALYETAAAAQGVRLVDVTQAMCAEFARTRQLLHGFWNTVPGVGHMNARGHAVVADALVAELHAVPSHP